VLKSRTRQYQRGAAATKSSTLGRVCTYVSQQFSDRMRSHMCDPQMANQKVTLLGSIFNDEGEETLTFELTAQMPGMVRSSRYPMTADSKESGTSTAESKFSPNQPYRRSRRREERRKKESKSSLSAGPSSRGTVCPDGDRSDEVPGGFIDDEADEFWSTIVNEEGGVVRHG